MASDESIGSCSLDADATASDASECVDLGTVSARTLRSLQLSTKTSDPDCAANKSPGGASTPEYVKRTARLFESSDGTTLGNQSPKSSELRSNGKNVSSSKTSDVTSAVVINGTNSLNTGENLLNGEGFTGKKPSYLGLACSVSGYSGITTYDSKLREGFRSRDHSPGRLGIIKSRDVSPLRPGTDQVENHLTPTYKSVCGNFLVAPSAKKSGLGSVDAEKVGSVSPPKSELNAIEGAESCLGNGGVSAHVSGNQLGVISHMNGDEKVGRKKDKIQSSELQRTMGDEGTFSTTVHHTVNGVSEKLSMATAECNRRPIESSQFVDSYSGSSKQEFFSDSTSVIRESTRNFMSSMLTTESSTHYESSMIQEVTKSRDVSDFPSPLKNSPLTSVPREGFGTFSPIKCSPESPKTALRDSPGSRMTSSPRDSSSLSSPIKHSPESPKTSSKDSLSAPATSSPQKRSPGAVRVVEFTSQTKSYVRTAFVSGSSMDSASTYTAQSYSDSSQLKGLVDGSQTTGYVRSVHSGLALCGSTDSEGPSDALAAQTNGSNSETSAWVSKSFIQQRVERLYGPGALAQGFFRRTHHKPPDEVQGLCESHTPHNGHRSNSSPALPVLRHLRPEFRAQLSLGQATRKLHEHNAGTSAAGETRADISKRSSEEVIPVPVQQQISVESLTESLTDLQPAAPEVVLPIEQSQTISSQPSEQSEETVFQTQKDGHYFLKLLKQEIDRLNCLVETTEADLVGGESLPEEALGKLRAASGQARLLIRQKLQQFEGLCHKNIAQSSEEPFPTTSEDLAGFWDMVMLQVEHVNRLFEEITTLRAANWVEAKIPSKDVADSTPKRRVVGGTRRSSGTPAKSSTSGEAARKAREEGRRKMMEERRKVMREKRDAAAMSDQVEIFVPQENGN